MVFAFLTVVVTVHAYVFYSLYVINRSALISANPEATGVLEAIRMQDGIYMFGHMLPIWAVILIEFCFAYLLENIMGCPCSFKLACKVLDPRTTHPVIFETAIICATVGLMCPSMSLIAALIYYPYYDGFNIVALITSWLRLVCFNFPFAFFTQLFFIQPLIRTVFKVLFRKDIAARVTEGQEH